MHRRFWLFIALAIACSSGDAPNSRDSAPDLPEVDIEPRRSNVLLIVVDSLRKDRMSAYGYARDTTPHIAWFAREAVIYTRATSQAPWTTPSIATLLSSHYPSTLGIKDTRSVVPEVFTLLPEALRDAGYATGAVVSHSFVSSDWGLAQGFDSFDESNILGHDAVTSRSISDLANLRLDTWDEDQPWFLFLHYFDPHFSYTEHTEFSFREKGAEYTGPLTSGMLFHDLNAMRRDLSVADLTELAHYYDSEIAFTDQQIGRVLDHLRDSNKFDDTLIIVTADHGEEFLDHANLGHAKSLFEELVGVPLIIKFPGAQAAVVDLPVGLIDLYPPITEMVGVATPSDLRGRSLVDTARGRLRVPDSVFAETSRHRELRGLVEGRYKLVLDLETDAAHLYDLSADPLEREDVSKREPERASTMLATLRRWMESTHRGAARAPDRMLTSEEEERLRALGYL